MILSGDLLPGERITEAGLAERLGVSRTPIRNALPALDAEGLLEPVGKRGYVVREFSREELLDALDLRATLEGLAAKKLAQKGASPEVLAELEECLEEGDRIFADRRRLNNGDELHYGEMNARFHRIVVENAGSSILQTFIDRLNVLPFVTPGVIAFDYVTPSQAFDLLFRAHGQHHAIVQAIRHRDGARAESVFREHANQQRQSMFERPRTEPTA